MNTKNWKTTEILAASLAALISLTGANAHATSQTAAFLGDTSWTIFATDEEGPTPGAGGQAFDAEYLAYKIDGTRLSLGLQSGFDLSDGRQKYGNKKYYAGDLALSFDGDNGMYEYAVDFGFLTENYYGENLGRDQAGLYEVTKWNNGILFNAASSPFAMEDGKRDVKLSSNSWIQGDASYFRWASFDLAEIDNLNLNGLLTVDAHWTMSCGNDNINGSFDVAPVPEPATMLLFGTGLAGLATVSRKKLRRS